MRRAVHQKIIYNLIDDIVPLDDVEADHKREVLDWIDSGAPLCRTEKPATPPKHLVSFTVVMDQDKLLLVDHKKAQLWLPPGGHVDPGEHPTETAKREIEEELGIPLQLIHSDPLFISVSETGGLTAGHTDVNIWYLFKGDSSQSYQYDEREFNEIKWFSIHNLPQEMRSDIVRFCKKLPKNACC